MLEHARSNNPTQARSCWYAKPDSKDTSSDQTSKHSETKACIPCKQSGSDTSKSCWLMSFLHLESTAIPGPHPKAKFSGHYTLVICDLVISEIFCFNNKPVTIIGKIHMLVPPKPEQSVEYIHRACSIEWPHCTTPSGRDQTLPSTFPLFFSLSTSRESSPSGGVGEYAAWCHGKTRQSRENRCHRKLTPAPCHASHAPPHLTQSPFSGVRCNAHLLFWDIPPLNGNEAWMWVLCNSTVKVLVKVLEGGSCERARTYVIF